MVIRNQEYKRYENGKKIFGLSRSKKSSGDDGFGGFRTTHIHTNGVYIKCVYNLYSYSKETYLYNNRENQMSNSKHYH